MITFFWHCDYTLTSWHYFIATAAVYIPCFVYPWLRTAFEYKWSRQAHVAVEDNGFVRITVPVNFHWTPGQHCFLRFTSFGILQAISTHPFTICSSPSKDQKDQAELVFYLRHQKGFTAKLYQHALDHADIPVPVLIDGPYGGVNLPRLRDADRLLVISGGSGAGWCLPFIEHFVTCNSTSNDEERNMDAATEKANTSAPDVGATGRHSRRTSMRVVLATRDSSSRIWFEQTVPKSLAKSTASALASLVRVEVHLTGKIADEAVPSIKDSKRSSSEASPSPHEKIKDPISGVRTFVVGSEFQGRPPLPLIVQEEATKAAEAGESLSVYVCGPITMQNDVRNAVALENWKIVGGARSGGVYLHSEHFSWA